MARKRPGLVAIRRVAGVVLFFLGLFVVFFGLGRGSTGWVLGGFALLLLAAASRLVTMLRGTLRQWVVGEGRVLQVSDPPPSAPYGRCELALEVLARGLPQESVIIREPRVPVDMWPMVGDVLPIEVAADDIRNVRILWPDSRPEPEPDEYDPAWDDDEPSPVPAAPPGSHLDHPDRPAEPDQAWFEPPAPRAGDREGGEIDFALDGPPSGRGTVAAAGAASPPDEGRPGRHVPLANDPTVRLPSPRPEVSAPAPARRPSPYPRPVSAPPPAGDPETTPFPSANPVASGSIHRVGVTLLVADLTLSTTFYRDRLGFHQVDRGRESVVLASGETRLLLRVAHEMDPVHRRVAHLNLEVADIDAVYADLQAAGVRFTYGPKVVDRGSRLELWAAAFKDPDGHGIALTQWRPRDAAPVSGSAGDAHPPP